MEFTAVVVTAHLPHRVPINLGILLLDQAADRLHIRFRTDLGGVVDPPDLEVIQGLGQMIDSMAVDMGATGVLLLLEDRASSAIRLGNRVTVHADNAIEAVERVFAKHVI